MGGRGKLKSIFTASGKTHFTEQMEQGQPDQGYISTWDPAESLHLQKDVGANLKCTRLLTHTQTIMYTTANTTISHFSRLGCPHNRIPGHSLALSYETLCPRLLILPCGRDPLQVGFRLAYRDYTRWCNLVDHPHPLQSHLPPQAPVHLHFPCLFLPLHLISCLNFIIIINVILLPLYHDCYCYYDCRYY